MKTQYIPEPKFLKKLLIALTNDCRYLLNNRRVHPPVKLPRQIGLFKLVRSLKRIGYPYAIGLYSRNRKQYIVKIWEGNKLDLYYFALLHEGNTMTALAAMQKQAHRNTPKALKNIRFPAFTQIIKSDNQLVLISEYVYGVSLKNISSQRQREIFDKTIAYVRWLGSFATVKEKRIIGEKHISYYAFLFPLLMVVVLLKFPARSLLFFKAAVLFGRAIFSLWKDRSFVLIHGDIHEKNVLVSGKNIVLLDVEQATFTYPEYEIISMLLCSVKNKSVVNHLLVKILEDRKHNSSVRFAGLMSNRTIHYLMGRLSQEKRTLYFSLLNSVGGHYEK